MNWSFGNFRMFPANSPATQSPPLPVQAKLRIGPVDHPLEREADDAADQIMRMPKPRSTIPGSNQCGESPLNGEESQKEMREMLARKDSDGASPAALPAVPAILHEAISQPGLPLDAETRAFFEPRFGFDFSRVRVHTGPLAAQSASSISARAFTTGHDMVFNHGQYEPHSSVGRSLIAHELTHVVQQREGRGGASTIWRQEEDPRTEHYKPPQRGQPPPISGPAGTGMSNVGSCKLGSGTLQWSLVPMVGQVNARIEFTPNPTVAATSKTISFVQTLTETHGAGYYLGLIPKQPTKTPATVDIVSADIDPFYGAKWDRAAGKWSDEPSFRSRPFTASTGSAVLNDTPQLDIDNSKQFETVAVVLETGKVLASLRWNIERRRAGLNPFDGGQSSTFVRSANCVGGASLDFPSVVESFYTGGNNIVLDAFPAGSAALFGIHQQQLAPIVDHLLKKPASRVLVGGAATQDEPDPVALSRSRAESVRAYLVGRGIAESRIDVEAYGSDWARIPVNLPGATTANRRVQIRLID